MPINRARIKEYLRQGEGAPPPVFVGHDDILEDVLSTAKDSAGQPKMTRIVQGAPGAGKTSLLHEMQKRWTGEDGLPRVVALPSTELLYSPLNGVGAVLDAWTMDEGKWKRTLTDRIKRLSGIGIGPGGVSAEFSEAQVPETLRMLAGRYPAKEQARPIIVAVDEAQRFAGKAYPFDYGTATCCAGGLTAGSPDSGGIRAAAATRRPVRSRKDRDSGGLGVGAAGRGGVRARVRGRQAAASVRSRYVAGGSPRPMPRSRSKEVRLWRRRFHRKTNSSR